MDEHFAAVILICDKPAYNYDLTLCDIFHVNAYPDSHLYVCVYSMYACKVLETFVYENSLSLYCNSHTDKKHQADFGRYYTFPQAIHTR